MNAGTQIFKIMGDLVGGRVFPLIRPETAADDTPYIIYTPISSQPINSLDGFLGHEYTQVQIDVYHTDYDELDSLVNQVIDKFRELNSSEFLGRQQLYDDSGLYRQILEVQFFTTTE